MYLFGGGNLRSISITCCAFFLPHLHFLDDATTTAVSEMMSPPSLHWGTQFWLLTAEGLEKRRSFIAFCTWFLFFQWLKESLFVTKWAIVLLPKFYFFHPFSAVHHTVGPLDMLLISGFSTTVYRVLCMVCPHILCISPSLNIYQKLVKLGSCGSYPTHLPLWPLPPSTTSMSSSGILPHW